MSWKTKSQIVRRTVREEDFAISAATLEGRLDADEAGLRRTALADAALSELLLPVQRDFARRYGAIPGGQMAVVALGKAGGREMMAGSDLDLMLVYDHPENATEFAGRAGVVGAAVFPPPGERLCRGADCAWGGRPTLCGGHAAAAVGQ